MYASQMLDYQECEGGGSEECREAACRKFKPKYYVLCHFLVTYVEQLIDEFHRRPI